MLPVPGEKHPAVSQPWYYSERSIKETLEKAIADFLQRWKYPWVLWSLEERHVVISVESSLGVPA